MAENKIQIYKIPPPPPPPSSRKIELELELYISIAQIKHNKHIECTLQYFQAYDNKVP